MVERVHHAGLLAFPTRRSSTPYTPRTQQGSRVVKSRWVSSRVRWTSLKGRPAINDRAHGFGARRGRLCESESGQLRFSFGRFGTEK